MAAFALLLAVVSATRADAAPQARPGATRTISPRNLLIGGGGTPGQYGPVQRRISTLSSSWFSQAGNAVDVTPLFLPGVGGTALLLRVYVDSTQAFEPFSLFVPDSPAQVERPLLACFHGFNTSHFDIWFNAQDFFVEADQRDWFLVAPYQWSTDGNTQINYSSVQSQAHVETVLEWVMAHYPVDRDRLYAVGFSMGGGSALNYAARHRDREAGAFAAVVNHTGSLALSDVYANVNANTRGEMELLFGGTPSAVPFEYQRSSLIDLDAQGLVVPGGRHMALNLVGVPVRSVVSVGDPQAYLVDQTIQLEAYMQTQPGASHELIMAPDVCGHCWGTLDAAATCDWFAQHVLGAPPNDGGVLADRDGAWEAFDVLAALPGRFSTFDYNVDVLANRIDLDETENILRIGVDLAALGLDPTAPLEVQTGSADSTRDRILLRGYPVRPSDVRRGGLSVLETCPPSSMSWSWCYDAANQAVEINEITSAGGADWEILP